MSDIGVLVVPLFWIIFIVKSTDVPLISPLLSNFCNPLKRIVTLTAFILEFVICLDIGVPFSTFDPTLVSDSILAIPEINVWFDVPNLGSNSTSWKLKSVAWVFVGTALALKTGVFPRNTSFNAAVL